jgi:two-component system nitrate/nitrite response regulator NarL
MDPGEPPPLDDRYRIEDLLADTCDAHGASDLDRRREAELPSAQACWRFPGSQRSVTLAPELEEPVTKSSPLQWSVRRIERSIFHLHAQGAINDAPESRALMLRVLLVSNVRIVQQGLQSILAQGDGIEVVSATDMLHAREQSSRLGPDVILLDVARQDSLERVKELVASAPHSKVVAFGVKETAVEILALAAAGTAGYIRDSAGRDDVVRILGRVMCDELPCSPRAAASLYRRVAALSQTSGSDFVDLDGQACQACHVSLSRREFQIAQLVECGLTNKEIGRQLRIEPATVKNHVHNMCEKLNVHRRGEVGARIRTLLRARTSLPAGVPDRNPALETD